MVLRGSRRFLVVLSEPEPEPGVVLPSFNFWYTEFHSTLRIACTGVRTRGAGGGGAIAPQS